MKKILLIIPIILVMAIAACAGEPGTATQPAQTHSGAPAHSIQDLARTNPGLFSPLNIVRIPPAPSFSRFESELNLTEDQKNKCRAIRDNYLVKSDAAVKRTGETMRALRDAMNASPVDANAVKEALKQSLKAEEELAMVCIDYWTEFRGNLTSEQDKKLVDMMRTRPTPKAAPIPPASEKPADK